MGLFREAPGLWLLETRIGRRTEDAPPSRLFLEARK